jgi:hypothetical protein
MRAADLARWLLIAASVAVLPALLLDRGTPPEWAAFAGLVVALALGWRRDRHAVFALRMAIALLLLAEGHLLAAQGPLLVQAVGVVWMAVGIAVAAGFLAAWAAVVAALVLPLALRAGLVAPAAFALAALALALSDDDTLALDAWLARRGGLFPVVKQEVVVEPLTQRDASRPR